MREARTALHAGRGAGGRASGRAGGADEGEAGTEGREGKEGMRECRCDRALTDAMASHQSPFNKAAAHGLRTDEEKGKIREAPGVLKKVRDRHSASIV